MSNCKNCGNPIQSHSGRRPREFCDNNQKCRNEWFRKNKKEKSFKIVPIEKWNEIIDQLPPEWATKYQNIVSDINPKAGDTQKAHKALHDAVLSNVSKKEKEAPVATENSVQGNPKTLDQLKALCPPELTGYDRSEWIRENRLKHGI